MSNTDFLPSPNVMFRNICSVYSTMAGAAHSRKQPNTDSLSSTLAQYNATNSSYPPLNLRDPKTFHQFFGKIRWITPNCAIHGIQIVL